ncbi:MAG TPA: GlsB/YeaQ/YmgE family stress response membrane protein [Thermoleophilaceae bacterium]|nr:GlsB/YeaQ/YmgE family stress response membrane protein [Thermoleophilaceae bacterium]
MLDLIGFLIFGLVVGLLARLLVPGRQRIGLLRTLLLGMVGSVVGGLVASLIGTGDIFELNFIGAIVAIAAAGGLLVAAERAGMLEQGGRDRLSSGSRR